MNKLYLACVFLSIFTIAPQVQASPMTYGCDTPADHFAGFDQNIDTKNFRISGVFQPSEFRKGDYSPSAWISLSSLDEKNRWVFRIMASDAKSESAIVFLEMTENGKENDPFPVGAVKLHEKLPFTITVTDGSKIAFEANELNGHPELNLGQQAKLSIMCSTGEFIFSDLEWTEKK